MAVARGAIKNYDRARQQIDFSGLKFGNITPTDTDGWFEYQNKCYVFIELKYGSCSLAGWAKSQYGQKLAFERQADDLGQVKPTLLILAQHEHPPDEDIDAANAIIVAYRLNRKWIEPKVPVEVSDCVQWFLSLHGYEGNN